jgi:poly-gamma-glutamate synthesis protein (capsule biosynthesis protein)
MITRRLALSGNPGLRALRALIKGADVAFTNLEVLPNDFQGYPALESGGAHLAAPHWVVDEMVGLGFNLFSAANNHALDYSIQGLLRTISVLRNKGVVFAGIGRNLAEARMPAYLDCSDGTSAALISCSSTFARGAEAGEQRRDMQGRPGVNPLHFSTVFDVTSDQFAALSAISDELGLTYRRKRLIELGLGFPQPSDEILSFLERSFRAANAPGVRTVARPSDVDEMAMWVREAGDRADLVLVSVHSHEFGIGDDPEETAPEFLRVFSHRMIDEGAHVVVCHGPHLLRGLEIYEGRPIFYSLGNFIAQSELVYKLPADAYAGFRVGAEATPGQLFTSRSHNESHGFPADSRYWESVVPVCRFACTGEVESIDLVPISLGFGQTVRQRGRPCLSDGDQASNILKRYAKLCGALGTKIEAGAGRGKVVLIH